MNIKRAIIGSALAVCAFHVPANAQDKLDPAIAACFLIAKEIHKSISANDIIGSIIEKNKVSIEFSIDNPAGKKARHVENCYFEIDKNGKWALYSPALKEIQRQYEKYTQDALVIKNKGGVTPEIVAEFEARLEDLNRRSKLELANYIGRSIPLLNFDGHPIPPQNTRLSEP